MQSARKHSLVKRPPGHLRLSRKMLARENLPGNRGKSWKIVDARMLGRENRIPSLPFVNFKIYRLVHSFGPRIEQMREAS